MRNTKTAELVLTALFTAIIVIMAYTPLGYIPLGYILIEVNCFVEAGYICIEV